MTDLLERPALATWPALRDVLCSAHAHTVRCWWDVELAGWVCPPPGGGPSGAGTRSAPVHVPATAPA